jgi:hypothetical protein
MNKAYFGTKKACGYCPQAFLTAACLLGIVKGLKQGIFYICHARFDVVKIIS